ncbi:uncharacterized protein N7459_009212 [Penicillium hispanicum]|uniref:uncharacterized protein n=1 Tax=Penicillium hispanicum TaxID=1080232 RepID=UPI00253FB030|nr:uncharacterized protein N7459_009212 [Penicillium hispanicum]KAJ5569782.1 hypothetical protein N7459_009212 [Penicillium hispanicum]
MTAAPPVAHPVPDSGMNGNTGHLSGLPRYHPIAMNPTPSHPPMPPPDQLVQNHHFRHFAPPPPPLHDPHQGPPPVPAPNPSTLEQIEARLRQLEHEEMNRSAARTHLLAVRKREDEEFRRMTENAELEEEELRRHRKRLKRESMGLGPHAPSDSPPLRPTPPRRLSETSAATTLAFFKQQSPPEPRQVPLPPVSQGQPPPPMAPPVHMHHPAHHPPHHPHPPPPSQHPIVPHDPNGAGSIRRKQKYTIKNVEAWGERHGRPAAYDPSGRALWKRPSDGSLVYLTCPIQGCGKSDFVTLHGFMCHLTKKHKDRTLGSQSRALEICGIVYDPNAPLPPVPNAHRASTESPLGHARVDHDGEPEEGDVESEGDEGEELREESYPVKAEAIERSLPEPEQTPAPSDTSLPPKPAIKQSISSIIDRTPETEPREALASIPPSESAPQGPTPILIEQSVPAKRKYEYTPPVAEKENTEPKGSATE